MAVLILERLFDPPSEWQAAVARRKQAALDVYSARRRGDTRDIHRYERALREATHTVVRLELHR